MDKTIELKNISVNFRVPTRMNNSIKGFMLNQLFRVRKSYIEINALKNINLDVYKGEAVGVVGKNGAGKSTLLKVLSRVIDPSAGSLKLNGKVSPLLGLGAGFHKELTGRENIYLKGAMLGFSAIDMRNKIDRIIDFSELQDFIDLPIRIYSNGMIARLGFSIAVDFEPDILLIDEVLAVGDKDFKEKAIKRMNEIIDKGMTIILVSHSIPTIKDMCNKAVWLENGMVKKFGDVREVTGAYVAERRIIEERSN